MSSTSTVTTYKVLGGIAATSVLTGIGAGVGRVIAVSAGKPEQEIIRDAAIGSTVMAIPSTIIGLIVASKPNLKSAGYTQAITSGLTFVMSLIGVSLLPTAFPSVARTKGIGQPPGWGRNRFPANSQRLFLGPGGSCVCPSCGYTAPHSTGSQCYLQTCPVCGYSMTRETDRILA